MVAYSFQKRFAEDVALGRKTQTIRAHRKRHARPGEPVQLYTGMRTKQCRKLIERDPVCLSVEPIQLWIPRDDQPSPAIVTMDGNHFHHVTHDFAVRDGFRSVDDFVEFWRATHGGGQFNGVMIRWIRPGVASRQIERA